MDVTAICERSGGWWAITVPEIEGGFTQAKRLDQVPAMVADLVNLATGTPTDQVHVDVRPNLADSAPLTDWAKAGEQAQAARRAQDAAAELARDAVHRLRAEGLPVRDVAALLGISPQRVSQLDLVLQNENGEVTAVFEAKRSGRSTPGSRTRSGKVMNRIQGERSEGSVTGARDVPEPEGDRVHH